ncbi:CDP-alcohol phosphatidyltransferase family protein [Candidatus Dependentiae bacterium]|nr:CDP-alcohol phosphatidyltransferase family protein [Candidatus Dependentiae bacterium]
MVREISKMYGNIVREGRWLTISNALTFLRILLVPIIVLGIANHLWTVVFFLLLFAGLTDVLDGYLARRLNEQTVLGACLDPIADKFLLIASFAALSFVDSPSFSIPSWFVFLVCVREVTILGGSFLLMLRGIQLKIAPSIWGKMTTFFQLLFILWIFICYFAGWSPVKTYSILIVLLALFSLISLAQYTMVGMLYLRGKLGR